MLFIPRKMKFLKPIAILFNLQFLFASGILSQENLDSIYKANKIVRIEYLRINEKSEYLQTLIINNDGQIILDKSENRYNKGKWYRILLAKNAYKGSKVTKSEFYDFDEEDKIVNHYSIQFEYQIYGNQEINFSISSTGRKTKEIQIKNKNGKIDSIVKYSNDSAVYMNNGSSQVIGKNLRMDKIIINNWDTKLELVRTLECPWSHLHHTKEDSSRCIIIYYTRNDDTTFLTTHQWTNNGEKITYYSNIVNKSADEEIENRDGQITTTKRVKNKIGLVSRITRKHEDKNNGNYEQTTIIKYFTKKGELSLN
jgi:hypothetical protein